MSTRVVHCFYDDFDVYIGRACSRFPDGGKWGNPFRIGPDGTREDVIEKHAKWLLTQLHLMAALHELKDRALGCWCRPLGGFQGRWLCHGQTFVSLLDNIDPRKVE